MRGLLLLACSGCSSILGIEDFKVADGGTPDVSMPDVTCIGPNGWRVCVPDDAPARILSAPFNTDNDPMCGAQPPMWAMQQQPPACFVFGSSITINTLVRVTGARPLVLASLGTIEVAMPLDVASYAGDQVPGAGSTSAVCTMPSPGGADPGGGGGGAGGTFVESGATGGESAGKGGIPAPVVPPRDLRAGCRGGAGGKGQNDVGRPGSAGGAVYLVARGRIVITSFINASGAGGLGGVDFSGGGGGGSGGMIVVHGEPIEGGGVLIANGGGGGGGSSGANEPGKPGAEPRADMPELAATGGEGAGRGGQGSTLDPPEAGYPPPNAISGGGGGGGGGRGYIRINKENTNLRMSPPPDVVLQ